MDSTTLYTRQEHLKQVRDCGATYYWWKHYSTKFPKIFNNDWDDYDEMNENDMLCDLLSFTPEYGPYTLLGQAIETEKFQKQAANLYSTRNRHLFNIERAARTFWVSKKSYEWMGDPDPEEYDNHGGGHQGIVGGVVYKWKMSDGMEELQRLIELTSGEGNGCVEIDMD